MSSSESEEQVAIITESYSTSAPPNDPDVWKKRRLLVGESSAELKQELEITSRLAEQHPCNNQIWDHRRWIIEKIGSEAVVNDELEFTKKIISTGVTNYQAWSHREWIIQKFETRLWLPEVQYCHQILDIDIFNVSAWDQICRALRLIPFMEEELRDEEAKYAKRAIYDHPGNEGPWLYLQFLYVGRKKCLFRDPYLECIYVDVLAEEADRIKSVVKFNPPPRYSLTYPLVDSRACLQALNMIADLMPIGYKAEENTRLVEAVDTLLDNLVWSFSYVTPETIRNGPEFYRKICALVLSLDACRIRYHYMYRGCSIFPYTDIHDFEEEMNGELHNSSIELAMDRCDDISPQQQEDMFKKWLASNNFDSLRSEWKEHLFEFYLKKRKRYDRLDDDALEDLKWDARRLVVQNDSSNDSALDELKYITDIIEVDAYNHRAWSHRHWVFQIFGEDWDDKQEIEFCATIIAKNPHNIFAWDQRYFVITRWVPRTYTTRPKKRVDDGGVFQKFLKHVEERRAEEIEFALTAIKANPENKIPWGHINGLYKAYSDSLYSSMFNGSLTGTILRVLEEAKVGLNSMMIGDGGSYCVVNGRGVLNALNMFCDIIINRGCSIDNMDNFIDDSSGYGKRFEELLFDICPDSCSCFSTFQKGWEICYVDRTEAIGLALEAALKDCRIFWRNAIDEILCRSGYSRLVKGH